MKRAQSSYCFCVVQIGDNSGFTSYGIQFNDQPNVVFNKKSILRISCKKFHRWHHFSTALFANDASLISLILREHSQRNDNFNVTRIQIDRKLFKNFSRTQIATEIFKFIKLFCHNHYSLCNKLIIFISTFRDGHHQDVGYNRKIGRLKAPLLQKFLFTAREKNENEN